jgi:hypothetical protein
MSELEFRKKLTKIREEFHKRESDARVRLAEIEKKKIEMLKRVEEMKHNALHDIEKVDEGIIKGKLESEAKGKLDSEIATFRQDVEKIYAELRSTVLNRASLP